MTILKECKHSVNRVVGLLSPAGGRHKPIRGSSTAAIHSRRRPRQGTTAPLFAPTEVVNRVLTKEWLSIALVCISLFISSLATAEVFQPRSIADIAAHLKEGEWYLYPKPIKSVLPTRKDVGGTTWGRTGSHSVIVAWNGAAFDEEGMRMFFHGGGHADYGGNGVYEFNLNTLSWKQLRPPYILPKRTKQRPCPQPSTVEHGPRAGHTYDALTWSSKLKKILYWNSGGYCYAGKGPKNKLKGIWLFDPKVRKWAYHDRVPPIDRSNPKRAGPGRVSTAETPDGDILILDKRGIFRLDPEKLEVRQQGRASNWGDIRQLVYIPGKDLMVLNTWGELLVIDAKTFRIVKRMRRPRDAKVTVDDGMAYHPKSQMLIFWQGGKAVSMLDMNSYQWRWYAPAGKAFPKGIRPISKWVYVKQFDLFMGVSSARDGVWFFRLPDKSKWASLPKYSLQAQINRATSARIVLTPGKYRSGAVIKGSNKTIIGKDVEVSGVVHGKGVFLIKGDDVTIEGVKVSLGYGPWVNEACFRVEGRNASLLGVTCEDTQMGVLTGGKSGTLRIENSTIKGTGINRKGNLGHAVYTCSNNKCSDDDTLILRNNKITDIGINRPGHVIKTRSPNNLIENNFISGGKGKTGRLIELPSGGMARIIGNHLVQNKPAENQDLIVVGYERKKKPGRRADILVENNLIECNKPVDGCDFIMGFWKEGDKVRIVDNDLKGNFRKLSLPDSVLSKDTQ